MNVMKVVGTSILLGALAVSSSGSAMSPAMSKPLGCTPETLRETSQSMQGLPPARTPHEVLALLRRIHDGFVLTETAFAADETIEKLFGQGSIKAYPSSTPDDVLKEMMSAPQNNLHTNILLSYSSADLPGSGKDRRGWLYIAPQTMPNAYTAELVEKLLTGGIVGQIALDGPSLGGTPVQGKMPDRRPFLTHAKGYFQYEDIRESDCLSSSLTVRLNNDGSLRDVQIEQRQRGDFRHPR